MSRLPHPCGTYGAYQQHRKAGEEPCEPCRDAGNAYVREWRHRTDQTEARVVKAARSRAWVRLAHQYRDEFESLFMDEIRKGRGAA